MLDKEIKIKKDTIFIIIGGLVLTIILIAPSKVLLTCPKGLNYDAKGGQCGLYTDANNDQVCDYTQGLVTSPKEGTSSNELKFDLSHAPQFALFTILLGLSIYCLIKKRKKHFRYIILIVSFIFLGILAFKNICPISTLQFLILQKDQIVLRIFPFLMFLVAIITTLIIGQIFCGWICPIGAFQELLFRIVHPLLVRIPFMRILFKKFSSLTNETASILNYSRYIILILVLIAVAATSQTIFCKLDPFGVLFGYQIGLIHEVLLVVFAILSILLFRPFCNYICPYGAILGILANLSIFKVKIEKKKCTKCDLCSKSCLIGAIDSKNGKVNERLCNRCGDCLRVCNKDAIKFQR